MHVQNIKKSWLYIVTKLLLPNCCYQIVSYQIVTLYSYQIVVTKLSVTKLALPKIRPSTLICMVWALNAPPQLFFALYSKTGKHTNSQRSKGVKTADFVMSAGLGWEVSFDFGGGGGEKTNFYATIH